MSTRNVKPQLELPRSFRIGIVRSLFNEQITAEQLAQALRCLKEYHCEYHIVPATGCFEIPFTLKQLIQSGGYDGFVALGCLIKGETMHFEVLARAVTQEILHLTTVHAIPIGFGIITALNEGQAKERTWTGYDATYAVLHALAQTQQQ